MCEAAHDLLLTGRNLSALRTDGLAASFHASWMLNASIYVIQTLFAGGGESLNNKGVIRLARVLIPRSYDPKCASQYTAVLSVASPLSLV